MRISAILAACLSFPLLSACADVASVTAPEVAPSLRTAALCDPEAKHCFEDEEDYTPPPPGLSLPFTNVYCRNATTNTPEDIDGDGIRDECAYQLAEAFAPMLVHRNEAPYPHPPGIPGEYLIAVGPAPASPAIRIAYLPAYYLDLGHPHNGTSAHTGDGEFIIVDVVYDGVTARWKTSAIFLSNHCGAVDPVLGFFSTDPNCKWYSPSSFNFVNQRPQGAPYVWVADGKHANYTSYSHCQWGTYGFDHCDVGSRMHTRFPVSRDFWLLRNSRPNWAKVLPNRIWLTMTDWDKTEDFWAGRTETLFTGWQRTTHGNGGNHGDMLRYFGVFKVGGSTLPGEEECDREAKHCG